MLTGRVKSWEEAPSCDAENQAPPAPKFAEGHSIVWYAKEPINHEDTLLGARYLCRTGGMFIVAPSGMGKSTLSIQITIRWCCGLEAFGILPRVALRILIVQSEDDKGDCTEMSQMVEHLGLSDEEKILVGQNSELIRCSNLVGWIFISALRTRLHQAKADGKAFDLVIINPYGVYLGADVKDTEASTKFLNEWLNSVLLEFNIAAILIHHTPKTSFQNTDKYKIWDWMYYGAGCASITNWARAILAIKPETEDKKVYRFIAAKRAQRIGEDWGGKFERFFAWSGKKGVLRWEEATDEQIAKASTSKAKSADLDEVIDCVPLLDPELKEIVETKVRQRCGLSRDAARAALKELCVAGRIFERPIPNSTPKRRPFAAWCQTNESTENQDSHCSPQGDAALDQGIAPDQPDPGE